MLLDAVYTAGGWLDRPALTAVPVPPPNPAWMPWLAAQARDHHFLRVATLKRQLAREHLEGHAADRVEVGPGADLLRHRLERGRVVAVAGAVGGDPPRPAHD